MTTFDERLRFVTKPRHRPWLVPDPGTEHVVGSAEDVSTAVGTLGQGLRTISGAEARAAARRHALYNPPDPSPCGTQEAALTLVGSAIADMMDRNRAYEIPELPARTYTVSRYGDGSGILLQQDIESLWSQEDCFLIDEDHAVHHYIAWDR